MLRIIMVFLSLLLAFSPLKAEIETREFVITGVIINSGSAKGISNFIDYLARNSDLKLKPIFVDTYAELSSRLRNNPTALGWTCGAPYVEDHANDGQQLISVPLFKGSPTYYSLILTRKNRSEKKLADFQGKILAYSDPRSNSGYLAPSFHLMQQGLDLKNHFKITLHAGNHEKSIAALLSGLADVAAVDEYVWVEYIKQHPEANKILHEIERLGPFPFTPIVTGRGTKKSTILKLQQVLTSMHDTTQGRQILDTLSMDGFIIKPDAFFQPIADMQRQLKAKKL